MKLLEPVPLPPLARSVDTFVIVVTGSRNHTGCNLIGAELRRTVEQVPASKIIIRHGACPPTPDGPPGADQIAAEWCASEAEWFARAGILLVEEPTPADWDHCGEGCPPGPHRRRKKPGDVHHPGRLPDYCPGAGQRRNRVMLVDADLCVGFPLGVSYGTYGCMRLAREAGIPVKPVMAGREAS